MDENQKVFLRLKNNLKHTTNSLNLNNKIYTFERVFKGTQRETFDIVAKGLTDDFIRGYNATLLAYGQTGSGKTYTIQGTMQDNGIIQRVLNSIFNSKNKEDEIYLSYIEIYNESLFDLFLKNENTQQNMNLGIREDPEKGIFIENIVMNNPKKYEEALDIFYDAIKLRRTASTKMNIESSRSHAIFSIYIENRNENQSCYKKRSKFHIVDLAGSERVDKKYSDIRIKESGGINKSLLCLSSVIEKLSKSENHVNYRDSKLTYLLKDCLGGNSKLVVIGNINYNENENSLNNQNISEKENQENSSMNLDSLVEDKQKKRKIMDDKSAKKGKIHRNENFYETLNTIKFLDRVKSIKNNPILNTEFNGNIEDLKRELKEIHQKYEKLRIDSLNENKIEEKSVVEKKTLIYNVLKNKSRILKTKIEKIIKDFELVNSKLYEFLNQTSLNQDKEIFRLAKIYEEITNERHLQIEKLLGNENKMQ